MQNMAAMVTQQQGKDNLAKPTQVCQGCKEKTAVWPTDGNAGVRPH
jgi:hypothetical protein